MFGRTPESTLTDTPFPYSTLFRSPIAGGDELRDGHANDDAEGATAAPPGFVIDPALATSLGLDEETRRALLGSFGFRAIGEPALQRWRWSGLRKAEIGRAHV